MHLLIWAVLLWFNQDVYLDQVLATSWWFIPVISLWGLRYFSFPFVATVGYMTYLALLPPQVPGVGYFQAKEAIYWGLIFGFAHTSNAKLWYRSPWVVWVLGLSCFTATPLITENPSLTQALMVCLLPFQGLWTIIFAAVVLVAKGSGMSALLALGMVAWSMWRIGVLAVLLWAIARIYMNPDILLAKFMRHNRLDMWGYALQMWWENHPWRGMGWGSGQIYGVILQKIHKAPMDSWWLSLHSDWVQVLFETGAIGFALTVWLLVHTVRGLASQERLCLMAISAVGIGYFPLDIPAFQLLIAIFVLQAEAAARTTSG